MKLSILIQKLTPVLPLLRCPICGASLSLADTSLVCASGHCFDLSARGYVNLSPAHDQAAQKYDSALFISRQRVFEDGFYTPVLSAIMDALRKRFGSLPFTLLDVGCGEGYYARSIAQAFPNATVLGVDLSRDAILTAARGGNAVHWFVADLKRLPMQNCAADVVLDVLTPADYTEFGRVLAPAGELIKLIPGQNYLREVRAAIKDRLRNDSYDNTRVFQHLSMHADILSRTVVRETLPLTPTQAQCFLRMTPMTFSIPREALDKLTLSQITIHMEMLRCQMR